MLRYRKVADHVLDVSWNPYEAPRLYPYPPVWVWVEAGAGLARARDRPQLRGAGEAAGPGRRPGHRRRCSRRVAGAAPGARLALRPAPGRVLVGRVPWPVRRRRAVLRPAGAPLRSRPAGDASALALSAAMALKSFPVLLLPVLLAPTPARARARPLRGARAGPVLLLLLPYALAQPRRASPRAVRLRRRRGLRLDRARARRCAGWPPASSRAARPPSGRATCSPAKVAVPRRLRGAAVRLSRAAGCAGPGRGVPGRPPRVPRLLRRDQRAVPAVGRAAGRADAAGAFFASTARRHRRARSASTLFLAPGVLAGRRSRGLGRPAAGMVWAAGVAARAGRERRLAPGAAPRAEPA